MNGEVEMRELEMWQPDEGDQGMGIEEDLTHSNGWSANEMFAKVCCILLRSFNLQY